jgi:hypothetical protein
LSDDPLTRFSASLSPPERKSSVANMRAAWAGCMTPGRCATIRPRRCVTAAIIDAVTMFCGQIEEYPISTMSMARDASHSAARVFNASRFGMPGANGLPVVNIFTVSPVGML